ncbi:MAG: DsbA family protein [Pseudomonadota bacterium]
MTISSQPLWSDESDFDERVRAFILENPEVILEALAALTEREEEAALQAKLDAYPYLFSEPTGLGMGAPDAPLRVIEFFDYRCLPCKAVHPVLEAFVEEHPEVRIEMRQLPILTPGSERGARFALAAQTIYGDDAYLAVHERLWDLRGPLRSDGFELVAADLGLDYSKIEPAMESPEVTERINGNRDFAIDLEILGTPAFVTSKTMIFGTIDIEVLSDLWLSQ